MSGPFERPKRVVFFLPSLSGGGAERVAVNVLAMLPDVERHLVLMGPTIAYPYQGELHVLAGDPVSKSGTRARVATFARTVAALRSVKREIGEATWLSFTTWANVMNVMIRSKGRIVVSSHSRESANIIGQSAKVLRRLVRYTYPRADLVISVSDSVKADLVSEFGVPAANIQTIYNVVDLAAAEAGARLPLDPETSALFAHRTIVTAGSFREPKGQWHLIRAFARARALAPDADMRLVLLGEGPLGPYLASLARDAGLRVWAKWEGAPRALIPEAQVAFLGFLSNPFAAFARAAVFVFPSLWEGFGNVILEAMACGALVLAADCQSGPREIIAPESPAYRRLDEPEYASAGILMPVLDGKKRPASTPLVAAEATWAEMLSLAVTSTALKQRYEGAARDRARAFSVDALAPVWRRTLLGHD